MAERFLPAENVVVVVGLNLVRDEQIKEEEKTLLYIIL